MIFCNKCKKFCCLVLLNISIVKKFSYELNNSFFKKLLPLLQKHERYELRVSALVSVPEIIVNSRDKLDNSEILYFLLLKQECC